VTRLLATLLLCSCAHESAVAFRLVDTRSDDDADALDDACLFWGLDCYETDSPNGAITLILTDRGAAREGETPDDDRLLNGLCTHEKTCNPIIFSIGEGMTLAHEIGHCVGWMDDRDDEGHVMNEEPGTRATQRDRARVHRGAERLAVCVGGVRP
jgi:hypothetical protein